MMFKRSVDICLQTFLIATLELLGCKCHVVVCASGVLVPFEGVGIMPRQLYIAEDCAGLAPVLPICKLLGINPTKE